MTSPPTNAALIAADPVMADAPADVLNDQTLADLAQLDPTGATQLVRRVLETYLSSLARLLQQLHGAWAGRDVAALRLSVHTLKSSSASIGALGLSEWCAKTELAVREGRLDDVERFIPGLVAESERVDAAVRQRLAA